MRRAITLVICLLLTASTLVVTGLPQPAEAAVRTPFNAVYSGDENGAISIVGNSQLNCPAATTGCTAARGGSGTNINNNNYTMAFTDNDASAATSNSTSADLAMPAGSEVLFAQLIWGGRMVAGTGGVAGVGNPATAKFRVPGQTGYTSLTASTISRPGLTTGTDADPYQSSIEVTDAVKAAGNGTYWFGDVVAATGVDRFAGWSLIVAYRNPTLPLRNLTVFEGYADITTTSTANSSVSATVSGFLTPAAGTVNATVGLVAWEGDLGITGDVLKFNNTTLSDAARPSTNSFDSAISDFGVSTTNRSPAQSNNFGVDMGRVSANGVLANGQTSATVNVSTTGDYIYLGALTTEVDLYTPSFTGVAKSVVNLSGNSPAKVGDTLEYRLAYTNSGQDFADAVVTRDTLPDNLTYVPGSLTVATGANAGAKTDAVGDDVGEYVAADRLIRVRLGTGATATTGGTIAVNASTSVTFRATVDRPGAGTTITNGALLDYRARTLARSYTYTTNTVSTPVQEIADLAITKTSTPPSQSAGSQVTYALAVTNNGPSPSSNAVTTDTLPAGMAYASSAPPTGTTCSASGQTVTCRTPTIAVGATVTIPITADVAPGTDAGSLVNQASVTADTADDVPTNNTATATTTVTRNADLSLTKTGPSTAIAGNTVTYTLTARNSGPSTATSTAITDTLPVGVTLVSTNPSQGTCGGDGQNIQCALGTIGVGATATVQVVGRVAAAFSGSSIVNTASITSTTPDGTPGNNTATATTTITRNADLAVTKTGNASIAAGNVVNFVITTTNAGPSDAAGSTLTDTMPAGLVIQSVTPNQGSCTNTTTTLSCTLGTITPASPVRVTVAARVQQDAAGGNRTNTATAATTTPESDTSNNSGSLTFAVTNQADVSLTKTASPNPVQPGNPLTYTLTARNAGPSRATGVVITDTLPDGLGYVSGGAGCSAAGQTVTCTVGNVDSGDTATRQIVVSTPGTLPGNAVTNTATVSADDDTTPGNNTASYTASLDPQADVSLTKTVSPTALVAGTTATYTLTARNAGPSTAQGVSISDALPASLTYLSSTASAGTCSNTGQQVSCALGSLANGATATVTITVRVGADTLPGSLANTATVASTTPTDPTTSNNTATSTSTVTRDADVGVTLTALTPTVRAGERATYRVTVTNTGPSTARSVVVTGQVPDGMEPVAGSSGGLCTVSGRTVTCTLPATLPPGFSGTFDFQALVLPSVPAGTISGTAFVGSTTPDSNQANNSDPETVTVTTAADLTAAKRIDTTPLVAGGSATYTLTATNNGPSDATGITLTDTLPAGATVASVDPSSGSCTVTGQRIDCTADRLAPSGVLTVRVGITVAANQTADLTNAVTVGSAVTDPVPGDNTATITTPVRQSADLRLSKVASSDTVLAGSTLTYTLTTVNTGPSEATAVVLDDDLPAEMTILAGGVTAPAGVTCTVPADNGALSCALGTLAPGASVSVTVQAFVGSQVADGTSLTNTATVTSPTPDPSPASRTASVTTEVDTQADLAITKDARSASPIAGGTETYNLTVVNNGPSVARAVEVTDRLPAGATFASAVNAGGTCTVAGRDVTCGLGQLARGAIVVVQITVDVDPTIAGTTITDTASVTSSTTDPNPDDNRASLTQPVSGQNDLDLTKTVTSGPIVAGTDVTYRVRVTNNGPSQARQVSVVDQIPDRLGYVSATAADGGTCLYEPLEFTPADDDRVRCTWDTLDVGDSSSVDLVFSVPADYPSGTDVVNTATTSSSAVDPTPASATTTDPVGGSADLTATKTLLSGAPIAGEEVRWQVLVRNTGPSVARAVTLDDPAPTGVTFTQAQTPQGDCTVTAGGASCALGDLGVSATVTVTLSGTLDPAFAGTSLVNTATVGSTTPDPRPGDNDATVTTPVSARADLNVTKTAAPATATAGQNVTWTVAVANTGPSRATQVQIGDQLPAGVTLVSQSLDVPSTCTGAAGDTAVACTVAALAPGATAVLTVVGRLDPGYAGTSVSNTATASSSVADTDPLDNSATSVTPVVRSADLAVTKTGPAQVVAGAPIRWSVRVANTGPSDATDVAITDQLPAGILGASASFPGGTCQVNQSTLTCPVGVLAAGADVVVTVDGTVDPASTATSLTNTASVSSSTPDPDDADRTATAETDVTQSADLAITKVPTTAFVAGEPVAWVLTVTNNGPSVARGVTVTDDLPAAVTGVATDAPGCTVAGQTLTCTRDTLAPGTPIQITVGGVLSPGYTAADLANTAAVDSDTPDPTPANDAATSTTPVGTSADLSVGKAITSGAPVAGAPITFAVTVVNRGPSDATDVTVTDAVPGSISDVAATTPAGTCAVTGNDVRCDLGTVADGATVVIAVTGVVGQDFGDVITNTAAVTASTPDPDPTDNTGDADATVGESADVSVRKTGPASADAGSDVTWTLEVGNTGPSVARSVTASDPLPAGVSNVRVTAPTGVACTDEVFCTLGDVDPGDTVTVTVTARLASDFARTTLTNKVTVDSSTPDPSSTNDTAVSDTTVTRSADLSVRKTSDPSTLTPGTDSTYTITVSNDGPSTAAAVVVTDQLPDGLSLQGDPTGDPGSCTVSGRTVTCTLDALDPGDDATFTLPVRLDPSWNAGSVANTVTVTSATPDPDTADNTTTRTSPVAARSDLTLTKTGPATVTAGTPLAWSLELSNDGPSDAQDVVITDRLPAGIGTVDVTSDQGTCSQDGATITCEVGVLPAGSVVTVRIGTAGVLDPSYAPGRITNTATVTSPTPDTTGGDDGPGNGREDSVTTTVDASADVSVTKVPTSTTAVAGGSVGWQITLVNNGPSTATDVVLDDPAVAGVDDFTLTPPAGVSCDADQRCTVGDLLPGADHALVFTVTADVPDDFTGASIVNTATAGSSTDDPDPGDNRATSPVVVNRTSGVGVVKTPSDPVAVPGEQVSWTVRVRNAGPSVATDVVVTDTIPAGVSGVDVDAPTGVTCTGSATVSCSVDALGVGSANDLVITLTGTLSADYTGRSLVNEARVTTATADPDQSDNASIATQTVAAAADVSIAKTGPARVTAGNAISWRVTVSNDGPSTARDLVVTDTVPVGVTAITATSAEAGAADCSVAGSTVTCTIDRIADGDDVPIVIGGTVDPDADAGTISNVASVTSPTDSTPDDNTSDPVETVVTRSADLAISKTVAPDPISAGDPAVFTLTVRNAGPSTARQTVVTDQVPAGMTIGAVTTSVGTCVVTGQLVGCDLGDLAPDADPVVISVPVAVAPDVDPDGFSNTASVLSQTPDPNLDDNTSTVSGDTATVADLHVTKTADVDTATAGGAITWTIAVRNDGPATARDVLVTDQLPASARVTSVVAADGGTCSAVDVRPLTCTISSIDAGRTATVVVSAGIDPATTDTSLVNTATAVSSGSTDPDSGDNSDTVTTPLAAGADVSITKTADTASVLAGGSVTWTLTVTNDGPATARDVVVSDPVPSGVTIGAVDGCEQQGGAVRCALGDLAPSDQRTISLTGAVAASVTGSLSNTATVSSTTPDPQPDDNTATATIPVRAEADLSVTKTVDDTSPSVGQIVTYTIVVGNAGPSDATGVSVQEKWPSGVQLLSNEASQGAYDPVTQVWTVGDVPLGATVTLQMMARITDTGQIDNSVTVSHAGGPTDPDQGNDVDAAVLQVAGPTTDLPGTGGPGPWVPLGGLLALCLGIALVAWRRRSA